jgi:hypothetical protein
MAVRNSSRGQSIISKTLELGLLPFGRVKRFETPLEVFDE